MEALAGAVKAEMWVGGAEEVVKEAAVMAVVRMVVERVVEWLVEAEVAKESRPRKCKRRSRALR